MAAELITITRTNQTITVQPHRSTGDLLQDAGAALGIDPEQVKSLLTPGEAQQVVDYADTLHHTSYPEQADELTSEDINLMWVEHLGKDASNE